MNRLRRRYLRSSSGDVIGGILFLLAIAFFIGISIWVHFFASCGHIGWLPAKEMPARCYTFVRH